jgi:predicted membrane-bound spermidine synthase
LRIQLIRRYDAKMRLRNRGGMILALFFFSGTTALVYEVVWSKFLSQMLGSTIYAQTVVLAAFMGGLALGNRIFGHRSDRMIRPVRTYGCLEIIIGIYALLFPALDRVTDHVFVSIGTHIAEQAGLLLALKAVLSVGLLLAPTILMGGTLPLLAAWLQKSFPDAGRRSALFYSINSLGAVVGAVSAGFWLVEDYGMVRTLQLAALTNLIVGLTAILLSRPAPIENKNAPGAESAMSPEKSSEMSREAGFLVALTGGISMGLELLASRSLALIFGSSLQSFAVVLISFILGISLGSAWVSSRRTRSSERTVVLLLCLAAAWVALLVFNIDRWVDFYQIARSGLGRTPIGYVYHEFLTTGIALVVLGLPAAWIGAVLPLMMRAVAGEGAALGAKVGALLTWNTLGAVCGTLLTGFVIMPQIGLRNAFAVLSLALAVIAAIIAWRRSWVLGLGGSVCVCALAGSIFIFGEKDWQYVMSSGAFRVWETTFDPRLRSIREEHIKLLYYKDGADATVSVEQVDGIIGPPEIGLRINGKPDAGTQLDMSNQLLLGHLPLLVKPKAKDVFVLGLASGITAGAVLAYPVARLDVAENCEPVVQASHFFDDWNHHALADPRTHLWREDARTVLKLHQQRYDVIITEPSNPWTVGVGSVFSREFYELADNRLKPGGIMTQWFHIYETDDQIMDLVLRTFRSVFPFVEVWDTGAGDIVMLGSHQPWPTGPDVFRQGFAIKRVKTDMWMIDIQSPEALLARQLASQRTGFAIAGAGPLQSDLFPILEYAAPRAFFLGRGSQLLDRFDERSHQQLLAPPAKTTVLRSLSQSDVRLIFSDFSTVDGELYACLMGTGPAANIPCVFQTSQPSPPPANSASPLDQAERAVAAGNLEAAQQLVASVLQQNAADPQAGYLSRVIDREEQVRKRIFPAPSP